MSKKEKGFSKLLKIIGAALGVVAFVMMFLPQINYVLEVLGTVTKAPIKLEALFGDEATKGAVMSFVGYLFALIGGALSAVLALAKKVPGKKILTFVAFGLMAAGAVLVFLEVPFYKAANKDVSSIASAVGTYRLAAGSVLGGIFSACGAGAIVTSEIVK